MPSSTRNATISGRKTKEAEDNGEPFDPEDKDDPRHPSQYVSLEPQLRSLFERIVSDPGAVARAIENKGLVAAVAVAKDVRTATRGNALKASEEAPPNLSVRDASREAPGLVERAKHLADPHDWSK